MKTTKNNWLGMVGIAACALCCTLPLVGSIMGLTVLVSLGLWLEKAAIGLLGFAFVAFLLLQLELTGQSVQGIATPTVQLIVPAVPPPTAFRKKLVG